MKFSKKLKIIISIVLIVTIAVAIQMEFFQKTDIQTVSATLVYNYSGKNINERLSSYDALSIFIMFNKKTLRKDNPSCGFTKDVSIRFGDMVFCIACDNCSTIKYQNKNKYFSISESDRKTLETIFSKYGATFPCE